MIVYLDQNKWIELARVVNGKDSSPAVATVATAVIEGGLELPLSAIHYMETARISDLGSRQRLGKVMWTYSKGRTLLSQRDLIVHEAETVLSKHFPQVQVHGIELLGTGSRHAFGMEHMRQFPQGIENAMDKALVTGELTFGIGPIHFLDKSHKQAFKKHLEGLRGVFAQNLPPEKWEEALYVLNLADIAEPFFSVLWKHQIMPDTGQQTISNHLRSIIDGMPSRAVDLHLHKQVLRNRDYMPKDNDLEDWAGLGVAVAYCDIVVCEKGFRDLVLRDKSKIKAIVLDHLSDLADYL